MNAIKIQTVFCITGWHFPKEFYLQISAIPDVDIFIVSHKKRSEVPEYVFDLLGEERILFYPNLGYDWGCYQQFLKSDLWRKYETIFFMHDDLEIHDIGFVKATRELLSQYSLVGNGLGKGSVSYTSVNKHPYAYAHSGWKPETFFFQHPTVRGSFFATKREVLEAIGKFEVYWDIFGIDIKFGNWSTKASCGKLAYLYGSENFGYLSGTFGSSRYITELFRGNSNGKDIHPVGIKKYLYDFIKKISVIYLEIFLEKRKMQARSFWLLTMKTFLSFFSGRF